MKKRIVAIAVSVAGAAGVYAMSGNGVDQQKVDLAYDTAYTQAYDKGAAKLPEEAARLTAIRSEMTVFETSGDISKRSVGDYELHAQRARDLRMNTAKITGMKSDFVSGKVEIDIQMAGGEQVVYSVPQHRVNFAMIDAIDYLDRDASYAGMQAVHKAAPGKEARPTDFAGAPERVATREREARGRGFTPF